MADEDLVVPRLKPIAGGPVEALPSAPAALPESVQPRLRPMFGADTKAPYPDMTPGPPKITGTSFSSVPTRENEGGFWSGLWRDYGPNSYQPQGGGIGSAFQRAGEAGREAFRTTKGPFAPQLQEAAERNLGWFGGPVVSGAMEGVNLAARGAAALGTTAMADIAELGSGGNPKLARDITAGQQIAPVLGTMVPRGAVPPGVKVNVPPSEGPPPMGPYPMTKVTLKTPEDAHPFVKQLYKQADDSGRVIDPGMTTNFLDDLNRYAPQSEEGIHAGRANPVTNLITDLRKLQEKPIKSMQGIQDIDRQIQDAISENIDNPNYVRQMNGILQDFRARTDAVAPEFRPAREGYAAQKRMEAVQNILDTTEDSPNRAQRIQTKVQNFVNNKKNTRGWSDEEIESLRAAGQSGMVTDWLKTQGSRLGTIITSAALSPVTGIVNFGSGAAARAALDARRVARLEQAMQKMGERVPQPGAVPQPSAPRVPGLLGTVGRYGPLLPQFEEGGQRGFD